MADRSYTVVIPCKDGASTIEQTLQSLFSQTIHPEEVIVIDDASKDQTPQILRKHRHVHTIRLEHNLPRSWARVPRLINLALDHLSRPVSYIMISGDDCIFPPPYVEQLLREFEKDPRLLISSGSHSKARIVGEAAPHGAGRVFRYSFLKKVLPFPETIGWESWVLFKALEKGGKTTRLSTVSYDHIKPYSSGSVWTFGHSMYELGYPFLFVLARFAKNVLFEPHKLQQFHMLRGYLQYKLLRKPQLDIAPFVSRYQKRRVGRFVARLLRA